jgi:hypothetical protein
MGAVASLATGALMAASAALLVACGGGGNDSSADGGSGLTGLVPPAPAVGATLLADATSLRPLRAGAEWQYRSNVSSGSAPPVVYLTKTVHTAAAGGGVTETSTGGPAGTEPDVTIVSAEGSSIVVREDGAFLGLPAGQQLVSVELRSPVRADDQITLIDRVGVPAGDLDGDRREDTVDVAAWSRVVGWEDLNLPELGATLRTLRVDINFVIRVKLASSAAASEPQTQRLSTWYAQGVGVVRRRETSTFDPVTSDERLVAWDGMNEGLGVFEPVAQRHGLSGTSISPWLPAAWAAAAVDGGNAALVVTPSLRPAISGGLTVAALDRRGRVTAVQDLPSLWPAHLSFLRPLMLSSGSGAALLIPEFRGFSSTTDLRVHRLSADGRLLDTTGTLITLGAAGASAISAAGDGTTWWVLATVFTGLISTEQELRLQPFDTNGTALAPPFVLDRWDQITSRGLAGGVAVQGGRAWATWYRSEGANRAQRVALIEGPVAQPRLGTLDNGGNAASTLVPTATQPALGSDFSAVLWRQPLLSVNPGAAVVPRGVTLDAALLPRRAAAGGIDNELLPLPWDAGSSQLLTAAQGSRLLVAGLDRRPSTPVVTLHQLTPGNAALATAAAGASTLQVRLGSEVGLDRMSTPEFLLPLNGRTLLIGADSNRLVTTSAAWR